MSKYLESFWRIFELRIPCAHLLSVSNVVPVGGFLCPISSKGSCDGAAVPTSGVKSPCLGFCGKYDYVLESLEKYVDGSVDAVRVINPSEVVMDGNAAVRFGLHEVSGVGRYLEDHVAVVEANDSVGVCVEVVHDPVGLFRGVCGSFGLLGSYFVEGDEDAGVNLAVEDEGAIDRLDVGDIFWV